MSNLTNVSIEKTTLTLFFLILLKSLPFKRTKSNFGLFGYKFECSVISDKMILLNESDETKQAHEFAVKATEELMAVRERIQALKDKVVKKRSNVVKNFFLFLH